MARQVGSIRAVEDEGGADAVDCGASLAAPPACSRRARPRLRCRRACRDRAEGRRTEDRRACASSLTETLKLPKSSRSARKFLRALDGNEPAGTGDAARRAAELSLDLLGLENERASVGTACTWRFPKLAPRLSRAAITGARGSRAGQAAACGELLTVNGKRRSAAHAKCEALDARRTGGHGSSRVLRSRVEESLAGGRHRSARTGGGNGRRAAGDELCRGARTVAAGRRSVGSSSSAHGGPRPPPRACDSPPTSAARRRRSAEGRSPKSGLPVRDGRSRVRTPKAARATAALEIPAINFPLDDRAAARRRDDRHRPAIGPPASPKALRKPKQRAPASPTRK